MPSAVSKRHGLLAALLLLTVSLRYLPGAGEWYALHLYPCISLLLSAIASVVPFSLEEWIVLTAVAFLLVGPVVAIVKRRGVLHVLLREVEVVLWMLVWFYLGWGCNYFRDSFYTRCGVTPAEANREVFSAFLQEFADSINACYPEQYTLDQERVEAQVKSAYSQLPEEYGLCRPQRFQHPKTVCFNRLYSGVGVLGYMGPFMAESQLNSQLSPVQYAFTYAHELSHLLGVSNEAEANYWAYALCTLSAEPQMRYSGYFALLPYLLGNAVTLLDAGERQAWIATLDPRIIRDWREQAQFWDERQIGWINALQEAAYDWYLRSNSIPSGKANYSQVVQMVLSVRGAGLAIR